MTPEMLLREVIADMAAKIASRYVDLLKDGGYSFDNIIDEFRYDNDQKKTRAHWERKFKSMGCDKDQMDRVKQRIDELIETEKGIRLPIDISGERYTDEFEAYLIDQKQGTNTNESEDFEPVELMTLSSREITCETRGELNCALTAFNQVLDFIKWFGKDHTDNETLKAMEVAITEDIEKYGE
jgi:hypothetical protein